MRTVLEKNWKTKITRNIHLTVNRKTGFIVKGRKYFTAIALMAWSQLSTRYDIHPNKL